ncbi:MAG: alpha/beta hydrolase family esterase [Myxococcota bacterium]
MATKKDFQNHFTSGPVMKPLGFLLGWILWCTQITPANAHTETSIDIGRGPVPVLISDDYQIHKPVPLIVSLHGFGGSGESYIQYWEQNKQVDLKDFIVVAPTGTTDSKGRSFWNATDACCDKDQSGVDDSAYLRTLIEKMEATYAIDPKSIHVTGYSNGGFMAHRMACEHADKIASIASVAGASFPKTHRCSTKMPVHVLHIHGTEDAVIRYGGGQLKNYKSNTRVPHPGAVESVSFWAKHNGAALVTETIQPMDLSDRTPGEDTEVMRFLQSGRTPVTVELWSIAGETHVPQLNNDFHDKATKWMLDHRKVNAK